MKAATSLISCLLVSSLLLGLGPVSVVSVNCNPMSLSSCAGAIFYSTPPTSTCCSGLQSQRPCFCQYKSNPQLSGYINSPNGRRVAAACGVPIPSC